MLTVMNSPSVIRLTRAIESITVMARRRYGFVYSDAVRWNVYARMGCTLQTVTNELTMRRWPNLWRNARIYHKRLGVR